MNKAPHHIIEVYVIEPDGSTKVDKFDSDDYWLMEDPQGMLRIMKDLDPATVVFEIPNERPLTRIPVVVYNEGFWTRYERIFDEVDV